MIIENHGLPLINVDEPKFQSINGALNYFVDKSMSYVERRGMTIEEVKSLLLKTLVYYRHSDNVKEIYKDFDINDFEIK